MIYQRPDVGSLQLWADGIERPELHLRRSPPVLQEELHLHATGADLRRKRNHAVRPSAFSPTGGPLHVSYANYVGPFSSWMQVALNEIGVPTAVDFNSGTVMGA